MDFIYDGHGEDTIAVEVASSNSHSRRGLNKLLRDIPRLRDSVYLVYPDSPIIQPKHAPDHIGELPLDIFLLAVAAQSVQEMLAKGGLSSPANYRVKQHSNKVCSKVFAVGAAGRLGVAALSLAPILFLIVLARVVAGLFPTLLVAF